MKVTKLIPFVFGAIALVAGFLIITRTIPIDSGDEDTARALAVSFVLNYKDATYGDDADSVRIKLKKWEYRKNHYILDVDAKWIGECCGFLNNTKCEVEKGFELQINKDGKLYSKSIKNLNNCAMQHHITSNATGILMEAFELSMDYNAITRRRVFVDEYGYEYYE